MRADLQRHDPSQDYHMSVMQKEKVYGRFRVQPRTLLIYVSLVALSRVVHDTTCLPLRVLSRNENPGRPKKGVKREGCNLEREQGRIGDGMSNHKFELDLIPIWRKITP